MFSCALFLDNQDATRENALADNARLVTFISMPQRPTRKENAVIALRRQENADKKIYRLLLYFVDNCLFTLLVPLAPRCVEKNRKSTVTRRAAAPPTTAMRVATYPMTKKARWQMSGLVSPTPFLTFIVNNTENVRIINEGSFL